MPLSGSLAFTSGLAFRISVLSASVARTPGSVTDGPPSARSTMAIGGGPTASCAVTTVPSG